jgi:hypothetical protein
MPEVTQATQVRRYYYDPRVTPSQGRWRVVIKGKDSVTYRGFDTEREAREAAGHTDGKGSDDRRHVPARVVGR